jgi:hypothetical protein
MHLHSGPDEIPGRTDAGETAEQAADVGMKAIMLKNYGIPTTPVAIIAREMAPEVEMFDPYSCSKGIKWKKGEKSCDVLE